MKLLICSFFSKKKCAQGFELKKPQFDLRKSRTKGCVSQTRDMHWISLCYAQSRASRLFADSGIDIREYLCSL